MRSLLRRGVLWCGLIVVMLLTGCSVVAAMLGAKPARQFFNSPPLILFWLVLALALAAGFQALPRLTRRPGLWLMHLGCLLVLVGSMAASETGHRLQAELFGINKIRTGRMAIYEQQSEDHVFSETTGTIAKLPFAITLKDFRIDYYRPADLIVTGRSGRTWKIPAELNTVHDLGGGRGTIEIVKTYDNFRLVKQNGRMMPVEIPDGGSNPACQVAVTTPGGATKQRYVFEKFSGHQDPEQRFKFRYVRVVRDYYSDVAVVKDGGILAEKTIEVNHPLHAGGYYFYQDSYDAAHQQYTILSVTSDTGRNVVFTGFIALIAGVCLHFWVKKRWPGQRLEESSDGD